MTVTQAHGNVILQGQLADIDLAIGDIKDAVAESVCEDFDSWSQLNGSSYSADGRSSEKLNTGWTENDKHRSAIDNVSTSHHSMPAAEKHESVNDRYSVMSPASLEIGEHVWHYIEHKYPNMYMHWKRTLALRMSSSSRVIEVTGQKHDFINFNEWYKKHDLTSVVLRVIKLHSTIGMDQLKMLVDSSDAAKFGVCVRFVGSTEMECIGKVSDIDGFISWFKVALRNYEEHKVNESSGDMEYSSGVNLSKPVLGRGNTAVSSLSRPVAGASSLTHKTPFIILAGKDQLKFKTAESQLQVTVLQGDLMRQKSQAIVNPANKHLLHNGGAAKAIQTAAGQVLIRECKDYIRRYKELPTSEVMHTSSGNLSRPINYVIHACGPNARVYPDERQCRHLLERTFVNCFTYANDVLHVQSLALPAISSGFIFVLQYVNVSVFCSCLLISAVFCLFSW